jgi:hypothetical protein
MAWGQLMGLDWAAKRLIVKSQRNAAHCGDQTTFVKVINDDFTTEKSLQPIPTMTGTFGSTTAWIASGVNVKSN